MVPSTPSVVLRPFLLHLPASPHLEHADVATHIVDVEGRCGGREVVDVAAGDVVHGHLDDVPAGEQWERVDRVSHRDPLSRRMARHRDVVDEGVGAGQQQTVGAADGHAAHKVPHIAVHEQLHVEGHLTSGVEPSSGLSARVEQAHRHEFDRLRSPLTRIATGQIGG
jgi:hypothetical protein